MRKIENELQRKLENWNNGELGKVKNMLNLNLRRVVTAIVAIGYSGMVFAVSPQSISPFNVYEPVKFDTSPPLAELLEIHAEEAAANPKPPSPPEYVHPNFQEPGNTATSLDKTFVGEEAQGAQFNSVGISAPPVILSADGIGQSDAPGGGLPPDTNGDVGPDHYIQYINTDWVIMDKTTGAFLAPGVMEGNTFWAGFGGACQQGNAGDPIVLYDKLADRWVFTQFTGTATNRQCFAISQTNDPAGPYHRYEYDFSPDFNDYPHISIWTDESGENSGYYLTTHDFRPDGGGGFTFLQASFSVVDRDSMLVGAPAAIVRFTDTGFAGASSFGALSAHLESTELPPAGSCGPFFHNRADLDAYLYWELCPDWDTPANSTLTGPIVLQSGSVFDNAVDNVPQPPPAPPGSELDNFVGNTMYRVSARAYPDDSGLPVEVVLNHGSNAGGGVSGVRWVHIALPTGDDLAATGFETSEPLPDGQPKILDEGLYSPDTDFRWMAGISIDQSRNIGVGYSVSSTTTFPSVRYTGRTPSEAPGTMLDEVSCVVGGGVQTFVDATGRAGRWGDYSSMSIDPVDQCTFWLSVEYVETTGGSNWENRVCSFKFDECGDPTFFVSTDFSQQINSCTLGDAPQANVNVQTLGFSDPVTLSAVGLPAGTSISFDTNPVSSLPNGTGFTLNGLASQGDSAFDFNINANSGAITRTLNFDVSTSSAATAAPVLTAPADAGSSSVRPTFTWDAIAGALSYEIDIATDSKFANIIVSANTEDTSFVAPESFDPDETLYWRVRGVNNCGGGEFTEASFTTIEPGTCPAGTIANIAFTEDFEAGSPGWTTPASGTGTNTWALSDVRSNSGTMSFLAEDVDTSSDQYLVSPAIVVPPIGQSPLTLSYWNFQNIEANVGTGVDACWDAGLLEYSTDGSTWIQIEDANMLTDPYNGRVTVNGASPISGLFGWCADDLVPASGEQEVVQVVDITMLAGQTVQFRYRLGTDGAAGDEGWYIDDVEVQGCTLP